MSLMLAESWTTVLAAIDLDRFHAIEQSVPEGGGSDVLWILSGILAGVSLFLFAKRVFKKQQDKVFAPRVDCFEEIVNALSLQPNDVRLLRKVIKFAKPDHPASILCSPANLLHATHLAVVNSNDQSLRRNVNAICTRIFGVSFPS